MAGRKRRISTGRFDERTIAARIDSRRRMCGVEIKELCAATGLSESDYSRKNRGITAYTLRDYEAIADALRAPLGWPFVDERLAEALEVMLSKR